MIRTRAYRAGLVVVAAVGLLWATAARADEADWSDLMRDEGLVVDQQPTQGGGGASDTAFYDAWEEPVWQQIADNILLTEAATIRHVNWWGFYGGDDDEEPELAPDEETMRVRFYAAREGDGLPGEILFEQSLPNPSRIATGRTIAVGARPPEYLYGIDLSSPIVLEADTLYWLEVVQIGDLESHFRWESGYGLIPSHVFLNQNVVDRQ